jgi:hypothetical protein
LHCMGKNRTCCVATHFALKKVEGGVASHSIATLFATKFGLPHTLWQKVEGSVATHFALKKAKASLPHTATKTRRLCCHTIEPQTVEGSIATHFVAKKVELSTLPHTLP